MWRPALRLLAIALRQHWFSALLSLALIGFAIYITQLDVRVSRRPMLVVMAALMLAFAAWNWAQHLGQLLASLARPESRLLPRFKSVMALTLGLSMLPFVLPFAGLGDAAQGDFLPLGVALVLLFAALGFATGAGRRQLVWLVILIGPALGFDTLRAFVWDLLQQQPQALAVVAVLAAILLFRVGWIPLWRVSDQASAVNPLDIQAGLSQRPAESLRALEAQQGALGKRLRRVGEAISQWSLERSLRKAAAGRLSPALRDRLVARLLLPNDNPASQAWGLTLSAALFGVMFAFLEFSGIPAERSAPFYAALVAGMRGQAVHFGLRLLRPSLVDVYMSVAPGSLPAFQGLLSRVLWRSLSSAILSGLMLLLVARLMFGDALTPAALVAGVVAVLCTATLGLSICLQLMDSAKLHLLLPPLLLSLVAGVISALSLALTGALGPLIGGALALLLMGGFAVGYYLRAEAEFLTQRPIFDTPL